MPSTNLPEKNEQAATSLPELAPYIETYTGRNFYFLEPTAEQIDIRDIAHALASTCRYNGHCNKFYSVAEHSVFVSYLATDALTGLLHDSAEAYICDIPSPIKRYLGEYRQMEDRIMAVIAAKFGFDYPFSEDIKDCDAVQLKTEAKYLLRSRGDPWAYMYTTKRAHGIRPECWSSEVAEQRFLDRYEEVKKNVRTEFESPYPIVDWSDDYYWWNGVRGIKGVPLRDGQAGPVRREGYRESGQGNTGSISDGLFSCTNGISETKGPTREGSY